MATWHSILNSLTDGEWLAEAELGHNSARPNPIQVQLAPGVLDWGYELTGLRTIARMTPVIYF